MKNLAQLFETFDFKVEVKSISKGVIAYLQVRTKGAKESSFKEIQMTADSYDELMEADVVKVVDEFNAQGMRVMDITSQVEASIAQAEKTVKKDAPVKKKATIKAPPKAKPAIDEKTDAEILKQQTDDNNKREDLLAEQKRIKASVEKGRKLAEEKKAKEAQELKDKQAKAEKEASELDLEDANPDDGFDFDFD